MAMMSDPRGAETLEALATVERQLTDAAGRLDDLSARSAAVADRTNWRTDAATMFHETAEAWRAEVAALSGFVGRARDDLGRVRARMEAHVWEHHL